MYALQSALLNPFVRLALGILIGAAGFIGIYLFRIARGRTSTKQAQELVEAGAILVDVRSKEEFDEGHIKGALNIPVAELEARMSELGVKDHPMVLYCASGMRSASAASAVRRMGFIHVHDLGPMRRWT